MYSFAYERPGSIEGAVRIGGEDGSKFLSGGMSLIPAMKLRLAAPTKLVDLTHIPAMRGIAVSDGRLKIGAACTHFEVAGSDLVANHIPALARLAAGIGDVQVRYRGTIGGSVANNDPAADYPAAIVALSADIVTDRRTIPADEFFRGLFETALEPGELIIAFEFPQVSRAAYVKFANQASRFAIAGVCVAQLGRGVRVAVTGASAGVFRVPEFEAVLEEDFQPEALRQVSFRRDGLIDDTHASAAYRAHLIPVLAGRAVAQCNQSKPLGVN